MAQVELGEQSEKCPFIRAQTHAIGASANEHGCKLDILISYHFNHLPYMPFTAIMAAQRPAVSTVMVSLPQGISYPQLQQQVSRSLKALFNNVFTVKKSELHVPTCYQCHW